MLTHLSLVITICSRYHYYYFSYFIAEEIETGRVYLPKDPQLVKGEARMQTQVMWLQSQCFNHFSRIPPNAQHVPKWILRNIDPAGC